MDKSKDYLQHQLFIYF